jgi:hypothetical protein
LRIEIQFSRKTKMLPVLKADNGIIRIADGNHVAGRVSGVAP